MLIISNQKNGYSMESLLLPYLTEIFSIAFIAFFMAISPGSDFVMVTRNSIFYGRSAGLYSSLGVSLGVWVHVAYSIAGLAVIISNSVLLFSIIKYLGAAYLIYIGWKTITENTKINISDDLHYSELSKISAFKQGFISNLLNPKTTIFFLSIFTQVVDANTPVFIQIIYGAIISFAHLIWFGGVSIFLSKPAFLKSFNKHKNKIEKVVGVALITFGIKVAATSNN
jgi:RhtB (resistance to homoserine/threonine) family protein